MEANKVRYMNIKLTKYWAYFTMISRSQKEPRRPVRPQQYNNSAVQRQQQQCQQQQQQHDAWWLFPRWRQLLAITSPSVIFLWSHILWSWTSFGIAIVVSNSRGLIYSAAIWNPLQALRVFALRACNGFQIAALCHICKNLTKQHIAIGIF